ncbi:hypothetical protein [Fervidibacter sp.]
MSSKDICVVGLRKEDAIEILEEKGLQVHVKMTQPPRPRVRREPVSWRVIAQREIEGGFELIVTPEWIDWLPSGASEKFEPDSSEAKEFGEQAGTGDFERGRTESDAG